MTFIFQNDEVFLQQNRFISIKAFLKFFIPGLILSAIPSLLGLNVYNTWTRILSIVGPTIIIISLTLLLEMLFPTRVNYYFRKSGVYVSYKKKNRSIKEEIEVVANIITGFEILPTPKDPNSKYLQVNLKTITDFQPSEHVIRLYKYVKDEDMKEFEHQLEFFFKKFYNHNT